jgi:3-hydroxyisobutyrate dehydrogenase-like beta-hydroxyacid dehydrogenase
MLDLKAGPMREHDYATLFKTAHMLKDVRHCLEEGQEAGVPFPAAAFAREVLGSAVGRGYGDEDFASVIEVIEGLADVRL